MKPKTRQQHQVASALEKISSYRKPQHQFIGDGAEALYEAERKMTDAMRAVRKERLKLMEEKYSIESEYKIGAPQVLYDIFNSTDTASVLLACESFLEDGGYKIERPSFEKDKEQAA